jgi:hypothetical protein
MLVTASDKFSSVSEAMKYVMLFVVFLLLSLVTTFCR